jgi:hypothetical protein
MHMITPDNDSLAIGLTNMVIIGQLGITGFSSIWKRGWS